MVADGSAHSGRVAWILMWVFIAVVVSVIALGDREPPQAISEARASTDGVLLVRAGDDAVVRVTGRLAPGSVQRFEDAVGNAPRAVVWLDSPGGALAAALEIGRLIRARGYTTFVAAEGVCQSACALVWLAGSPRVLADGAAIGFHAAYRAGDPQKRERGAPNALVGSYLADLGHSDALIWEATRAAPDGMVAFTSQFAARTGLPHLLLPASVRPWELAGAVGPSPVTAPASIAYSGRSGERRTVYGRAEWAFASAAHMPPSHLIARLSRAASNRELTVAITPNTDPAFDGAVLLEVVFKGEPAVAGITGVTAHVDHADAEPIIAPYAWTTNNSAWLSLGRRGEAAAVATRLVGADALSIDLALADGRQARLTLAKGKNWTAETDQALAALLSPRGA